MRSTRTVIALGTSAALVISPLLISASASAAIGAQLDGWGAVVSR